MLEKRNSRHCAYWLWFYLFKKIQLSDFGITLWQI